MRATAATASLLLQNDRSYYRIPTEQANESRWLFFPFDIIFAKNTHSAEIVTTTSEVAEGRHSQDISRRLRLLLPPDEPTLCVVVFCALSLIIRFGLNALHIIPAWLGPHYEILRERQNSSWMHPATGGIIIIISFPVEFRRFYNPILISFLLIIS